MRRYSNYHNRLNNACQNKDYIEILCVFVDKITDDLLYCVNECCQIWEILFCRIIVMKL